MTNQANTSPRRLAVLPPRTAHDAERSAAVVSEALFRSNEERFRLLVEGVEECAIFMLDLQGNVTTWNPGAERIKGYRADEIVGRHFSVFRLPEEAGEAAHELEIAACEGKFEGEGWRVRKDGAKFWARVCLTAIRDSNGQLVGYAKLTFDLTQRLLLDEERVQRARAEEAVRLRDEFLLMASHELRTPLTSLRLDLYGMQQDLARKPGDTGDLANPSSLAKKLERAARNTDRLIALIDSMLSVSHLAHGKLVLRPVLVDLSQVVSQSIESIRSQAARSSCEISFSSSGPVLGLWDGLRLEQVCLNLLANAIKYGAGAPIEVIVFVDDAGAAAQISDRGPGIAQADMQRIFERFGRASSLLDQSGLGLGLYVSREIVRAHAGSIEASNREGGGAVFTVRLPMQRDEASAEGRAGS
ncbi:MAG: PAS domain-containing sensor histidine kinase [Polyangia bacterium]|jgi:PAS domain S-box-containing protein